MTSLKIRSIKYNFFMNLLLTGSSVIFPLITFPLVSRALYSDMYGLCNWAFSIVSWLSLIAMLGVNRYGIREVAKNRDNEKKLRHITEEIFFFTLITTLIILFCFIASIFFIDSFAQHRSLFLLCSVSILCNTLGVGWFFQGIEQYTYITIRGVIIKIICFLGVIAFVHAPDDYLIYAALIVLSAAGANLINFFYMIHVLYKHVSNDHKNVYVASILKRLAYHKFSVVRKHTKPLLTFFIIAAAISIYTVLDTVMLGFLSSDQQVGYYSAAMNVKSALVGVVSALSGVLLPRASNMLQKKLFQEYTSIIKKCIALVLCISIPLSVLLAICATPLLNWYAGADFASAGPVLSIVAIAIIPIGLSVIFCDAIMVPNGLERYCTFIYIFAALIDFIGNLVLIPMLGATGAAISTLTVEVLIMILEFIFIRKIIWPSQKSH